MAQYNTGTVTVTQGSNQVQGSAEVDWGFVAAGDIFTKTGSVVIYTVGDCDPVTRVITLVENYAGESEAAMAYEISTDFSPQSGYPLPSPRDTNAVALIRRALLMLDGIDGGLPYGTSTTALTIGTGSKTLTTQTLLGFRPGMDVTIALAGGTNRMQGVVLAYNAATGSMTVQVVTTYGTGSWATWNITFGEGPANAVATGLDAVATAADRVQTGLDAAATAADRVQTGLDAAATAADRVQTGLDADATAADRVQTELDAVATAADRVQTGLDAAATAADRVQTGLDASEAAASAETLQSSLASIDPDILSLVHTSINPAWPSAVACCITSSSLDTDVGAWKKRCADKSWYAEARPSGQYLGAYANEAAARAAGGTTGDWYARTTAPAFYSLNASSGETQIYRAGGQGFPAEAAIYVWADKRVIFDLTQPGAPMWKVTARTGKILTSVSVRDGVIVEGSTTGVFRDDFANDRLPTVETYTTTSTPAIVNATVNSVAIAALSNPPANVATGLPVPTQLVLTAGGPSWITDTGSVWDGTGGVACISGDIQADGLSAVASTSKVYVFHTVPTADIALTSANYTFDTAATSGPAISGTIDTVKLAGGNRILVGTSAGLFSILYNRTAPSASLVAKITSTYNPGRLPGDIRGAWLADSVVEVITGAELVTGWTNNVSFSYEAFTATGSTITSAGNSSGYGIAYSAITLVVGKTYVASYDLTLNSGTAPDFRISANNDGSNASSLISNGSGKKSLTFVAGATNLFACFRNESGEASDFSVANFRLRLAVPDRSVKGNGAQVFGSITKTAVATGAGTMGYSGFSAANYIEQPYNADLNPGTAAFNVLVWLKEAPNSATETIFQRDSAATAQRVYAEVDAAGHVIFGCDDNATDRAATSTITVDDSFWHLYRFYYNGAGGVYIYRDGGATPIASATGSALLTLTNTAAALRVGLNLGGTTPLTNGTLAAMRFTTTDFPSEAWQYIYETEKGLFQSGTQPLLPGTSDSILSLGYDEVTATVYGHTSYGRFGFRDLTQVDSEASSVGTPACIAAHDGAIVQGGSTAVAVYVPSLSLRAELARRAEQKRAFGRALEPIWFTGDAATVSFPLPAGWEPKSVYNNGALVRDGAANQYTVSFDGFIYRVVFAVAPGSGNNVCVMARRVAA